MNIKGRTFGEYEMAEFSITNWRYGYFRDNKWPSEAVDIHYVVVLTNKSGQRVFLLCIFAALAFCFFLLKFLKIISTAALFFQVIIACVFRWVYCYKKSSTNDFQGAYLSLKRYERKSETLCLWTGILLIFEFLAACFKISRSSLQHMIIDCVQQGQSIFVLFWCLVLNVFFGKKLFWGTVEKESVMVMPNFGIQLETHYISGRVIRQFVPVDRILKPVLLECVTPVTCYWSLSLIIQGEDKLLLVFKELRPPVKMLVPVWKALCAAAGDNNNRNTCS